METILVGGGTGQSGRDYFPGMCFEKSFRTIGEALSALEDERRAGRGRQEEKERDLICILPGVYEENLSVTLSHLSLRGAGRDLVRIVGKLGGYEILEDGIKRGTFRTQTVFVHGKDIEIRDLTIENRAGQGYLAGQALALYADGDELLIKNVDLLGHQDTLFVGPLPEKEIEPGGFRGPLEHAPRINGRQCYQGCRIAGTVDFIFGSGTAWFEDCEILALDQEREGQRGFVTAPSTPRGQDYGFVFSRCRFGGTAPEGTVFLGRPWRDYGQTVLVDCELGPQICPEGWDDWGKELARRECLFAEYGSRGEGSNAGRRASFARILDREEAARFVREKVLEGWNPG